MNPAESLSHSFMRSHPEEAARVVETLPETAAAELLFLAPVDVGAGVLLRMGLVSATACLATLRANQAARLLEAMEPGQGAILCRRLDFVHGQAILRSISPDRRAMVKRHLAFPEGTAGAIMSVTPPVFPPETLVKDTWEQVRKAPGKDFYHLYVVNRAHQLAGVLNLKELVDAPPDHTLGRIMNRNVMSLPADANGREIIAHPGWLEFHALPVVNAQNRFLGVVGYETVRRLERANRSSGPAPDVGLALSELCWVGLSTFSEALAKTLFGEPDPKPSKKG